MGSASASWGKTAFESCARRVFSASFITKNAYLRVFCKVEGMVLESGKCVMRLIRMGGLISAL